MVLFLCAVLAATPDAPGPQAFAFADALAADGDHYRAITEYKRAAFLDDSLQPEALLRIGKAYVHGDQPAAARTHYAEALTKAPELARELELELAYATYRSGSMQDAQDQLSDWLERYPARDDGNTHRAQYILGFTQLALEHPTEAATTFRALPSFARQARLVTVSKDLAEAPRKSVLAAALLSLVPGLGHVYLGQPLLGLAAFAWNAVFVWATAQAMSARLWGVGAVTGFFELAFYGGTIFGAVSGAHKYNRDLLQNSLDRAREGGADHLDEWPPAAP